MKGNEQIMSSARTGNGRDDWSTPRDLLSYLEHRYLGYGKFDLDPCCTEKTKCARDWFGQSEDGLSRQWYGNVFLNPPYSHLRKWLEKAIRELNPTDGNPIRVVRIVALVPARTDTKAWHGPVSEASEVILLKGRLRFLLETPDGLVPAPAPAPFPSAIIIWKQGWSAQLGGPVIRNQPADWGFR
jgi:phage N-6-adenine-methyltransferase